MACLVKGELTCKDGTTKKFAVGVENNLKSVIAGVKKINSEISVVLTELVEEEKQFNADSGECRAHGEDDDEEEESEEDAIRETNAVKLKSEPPLKRLKV